MKVRVAVVELALDIEKEVAHYWAAVNEHAEHLEYLQAFQWVLGHLREVGECLEFRTPLDKDGYGIIHIRGVKWRVHRLIWTHYNGDVTGLDVHHTCYNRACANLEHLMAFTHKEHIAQHMRDKKAQKRR